VFCYVKTMIQGNCINSNEERRIVEALLVDEICKAAEMGYGLSVVNFGNIL